MISEAQAAAQNAISIAGDLNMNDLKAIVEWLIIPVAGFIYRIDRKLTQIGGWTVAHTEVDNIRFAAHEKRVNDLIDRIDGMPISTAGLKEAKSS